MSNPLEKISRIRVPVQFQTGTEVKIASATKAMTFFHVTLKWIAGCALLGSVVTLAALVLYFTIRVAWKAKGLIDSWLVG